MTFTLAQRLFIRTLLVCGTIISVPVIASCILWDVAVSITRYGRAEASTTWRNSLHIVKLLVKCWIGIWNART